jgi:hypothetical protein
MGVSIHGTVHPHLHSPCPRCGYATRFKQFGPIRCLCSPASGIRTISQRSLANENVIEIQAEQEQKNAALHKIDYSHIPPLRIADRYTAGRPRR